MSVLATSSQTAGPYVHIGFEKLATRDIAPAGVTGERVTIGGRVIDGNGAPFNDGYLEIWQANAHGRYAHPEAPDEQALEPAFKGFGRFPTDRDGRFRFTTIKPGRVPMPQGGLQAPHLNVLIFARGLLKQLTTRMYFPDEAANADDPVLKLVPEARRGTLVARRAGNADLEWNIVLKGHDETVFLVY